MKMKTNSGCLKFAPGTFELVLIAAMRAKEIDAKMKIESSHETKVDGENPVKVSLYEIATKTLEYDDLKNNFINSIRTTCDMENIDDMDD